MGAIFKFILIISGIYFLLSILLGASVMRNIIRIIFLGRRKPQKNDHNSKQEPITQNDRIITYKKKEFETSVAEDVDFEEIKKDKK